MVVLPALFLALQARPIEVTVYNGGFGFVKENRSLNLKSGIQDVDIDDVAGMIETNSVGIRSLTAPGSFSVLEQNYLFDLVNAQTILEKSVGKTIKLHRALPKGGRETIEGVLLSTPDQGLVIRTRDGQILLNPEGEIEVPSIPAGMVSKPTLRWRLDSDRAGANQIELSYLTQGMSWTADYVLVLDDASKASLRGWVTIANSCGATFKNAQLKLIAGDVQRAPENKDNNLKIIYNDAVAASSVVKPAFAEESLFEYHLYTLQRPATLRNNEQKQISLLEGSGITYEKKLIVDSMMNFGMYYPSEGEIGTGDIKPLAKIEFKNSLENHLGMPLPKGNFKVYQRDKNGSLQMVGEDAIDHTPKNEKLSLTIGRSFDVRVTRKRTNFKRIDDTTWEESFEVEVRNRKDVPQRVYVYERHFSEWTIPKTSMKFDKLDSQTMQYVVDLKANDTRKITYTVITHW
jgi:hypothetical protein